MTNHARTIGSLFSGIGGLELGLERAGVGRVVWQVERDAYCRRVLARHWPDAVRHDDVKTVGAANLPAVDVICGGFPCQPVSVAGKRLAQEDERWLWPEYARIIGELRPAVVVAENVPGLRTAGLGEVMRDLAALGYDAWWGPVSAVELGAPHVRRRLFVVAADADRFDIRHVEQRLAAGREARALRDARFAESRRDSESIDAPHARSLRRLEQAVGVATERGWSEQCGWPLDPIARVDDGIPRGMVGARRKALGNAVCVPVAQAVGEAVVAMMTASDTGAEGEGR